MEETEEIIELKKEKKNIQNAQIFWLIYFCVLFSLSSLCWCLSLYDLNPILSIVLLIIFSVSIPITIFIVIFRFIKKEKRLNGVGVFTNSAQYTVVLYTGFSLFFAHCFKEAAIDDLSSVIAIYSISWGIIGVIVSVMGIWVSINFQRIIDKDKNFSIKFSDFIGLSMIFLALIASLIFQIVGVTFFQNNTAVEHGAFYLATLYFVSVMTLNVVGFFLLPLLLGFIGASTNDYSRIVAINAEIELKKRFKKE